MGISIMARRKSASLGMDLHQSVTGTLGGLTVRNARPLCKPLLYCGGSNLRRLYEAADLPDRLCVSGDSLCSFNPAYGQGMTVAALEVQALQGLLQGRAAARGRALDAAMLRGVSAEYQALAGPIADVSFNLNCGEDQNCIMAARKLLSATNR
ncbi:hypothetical protein WJX81_006761 [Elliptochloris bilobata]|uniref:Uncharacterized protein n=1 Tax=Elliptochloris bilobata TaxID=381761 RepID=A0AAW1QW16_9CHLO